MILTIVLLLTGLALFVGTRWLDEWDGWKAEASFPLTILSAVSLIGHVTIVPLNHTLDETKTIAEHQELLDRYTLCLAKRDTLCTDLELKVLEFNKDLRVYKHYNEIFDYYYSDEVAELPLIAEVVRR